MQSYHLHRSGDLDVVLNPFWIRQKTGTTYGTPYPYDSHSPLIFLGNRHSRRPLLATCGVNGVAPTLATRSGVSPSGYLGMLLSEVLAPAPAAPGR